MAQYFKKHQKQTFSIARLQLLLFGITTMIGSFTSIRCVNSLTAITRTPQYAHRSLFVSVASRTCMLSWGRKSSSSSNANSLRHFTHAGSNSSTDSASSVAAVTAAAISLTATITSESTIMCDDNNGTNENFPDEALHHDTYNGVTIDTSKISPQFMTHNNGSQFLATLKQSLNQWRESGKRGIWIHIPTEFSHIISTCIELGFDFQHAKNGLLVLTQWLPDQPSRLPHGPTHQLGVGVIIIHPITKKMLVVQEKTGPAAGKLYIHTFDIYHKYTPHIYHLFFFHS